ncbi:hypothetical protein Q3G72_019066 [Acer saccharum]|nr:hypothetical protein Q3G72_019066 [Acer saccharum]
MAACSTIAPAIVSSSGVQQHSHHHRHQRKKDKMVVIMGATDTEKSRLSIDLATRFSPCEIVNSDKMQVYKGLDITTNKIAFHDRRDVPHHFLDEFGTDEVGELSPSEFHERAELTISDIISRKRTPFLVGGSNSFVYSLLVEEYGPDSDVYNGLFNLNSVSSELRYDCCFLELTEFFDSDELDKDLEIHAGLRKAIGVPEFQRYFKKYPPRKYKGLDQLASRHTHAVTTSVRFVANPWEIWRFTLACLMHFWLPRSFQKNTGIAVRIYYAMTAIRRGLHASTGCTTNAGPVDRTIPE